MPAAARADRPTGLAPSEPSLRRFAESSVLDPKLTIILVEVARRLGMGFIAARAELEEAKARRVGAGDRVVESGA